MALLYKPRGRTLLPVLLSVCWVGCSRPAGNSETGAQAGQTVPFRNQGATAAPGSDSAGADPQISAKSSNALPFGEPQKLPAGTMLTVRLKEPISSDVIEAKGAFTAVVDDPVVMDGATLVPSGAKVQGHVESTSASAGKPSRGFVRLTLSSIELGGAELPLQTSSLFARGTGELHRPESNSGVVRLEQGRRLTFRLTEPVPVVGQIAKSTH